MKTKISILFLLNFILLTACKKEETKPEDDTSTYFIKAKFDGQELLFDDSGIVFSNGNLVLMGYVTNDDKEQFILRIINYTGSGIYQNDNTHTDVVTFDYMTGDPAKTYVVGSGSGQGTIEITQSGTQYHGTFSLEAVNITDNTDVLQITNGSFKLTGAIQ